MSELLQATPISPSLASTSGVERTTNLSSLKRLLLLTTNHVGNNLFCTPAIGLLKKHLPNVKIDVVAMSVRGAGVFAHNPDIDRTILCRWKWVIQWLAQQYDLIIGLHHDVARPYLAGMERHKAILLAPPDLNNHRAEATLQSVRSLLGCAVTNADRQYRLCPQPDNFAVIDRRLHTDGSPTLLVGMHLGSGRAAVHGWRFWSTYREGDPRAWPLERYVTVGTMLRAIVPHVRVVLTGSWQERFLARRFRQWLPDAIDLVGKTSLLDLAALMRRLAVFVTHDTGALHVASASPVPLVGLFGPTYPHRTGPYPRQPHTVIIKRVKITDIQPEEVCAAVVSQLALRHPGSTATWEKDTQQARVHAFTGRSEYGRRTQ